MVGLLDLAPLRKTVHVMDRDISVRGIPAYALVRLLDKFPELRKMFAERAIKADELIKMGPEIVSQVIAAGLYDPDHTEMAQEKGKDARRMNEIELVSALAEKVHELALGDQAELLTEILMATFKQGVGSFVERLEGLGIVGSVGGSKAPDTRLPSQFNGLSKSADTPSEKPGNAPPAS